MNINDLGSFVVVFFYFVYEIHVVLRIRYADDTVLIADSVEKSLNILTTVSVESENKGLQLNAKKTECMVISKKPEFL